MHQRREALGGFIHRRQRKAEALRIPPLSAFDTLLKAGGEVVMVPAERMPTTTGAAAVYRF